MIAYCGLTCENCPIHLATIEPDNSRQQAMRESIAEQCSKLYGMKLRPEDINDCDGCSLNTGRLFSGCLKCEIRICASQKNIQSCANCPEYVCDKLKVFFSGAPDAFNLLEEIRKTEKNV